MESGPKMPQTLRVKMLDALRAGKENARRSFDQQVESAAEHVAQDSSEVPELFKASLEQITAQLIKGIEDQPNHGRIWLRCKLPVSQEGLNIFANQLQEEVGDTFEVRATWFSKDDEDDSDEEDDEVGPENGTPQISVSWE